MDGRALVIHASDLLAKGFVAIPPDRADPKGNPTNALYGVTRAVRAAIGFKDPAVAVAVVDADVPEDWPDGLKAQAGPLVGLLEAHGFAVVPAPEPIQVVGAYVRAALESGYDVVVAGSDKRLAQLVGPDVWWYDGYKDVRYTPETVYKRFRVGPESVAGWLALVGDDDALSGVKGIGAKGATDLIAAHGSVAAALADPDAVQGRSGKALRASLDAARAQLDIAVLRTDIALPVPLDALPWAAPDADALNEAYADLGFYALLEADPDASRVDVAICASAAAVEAALAGLGDAPAALYAVVEDPSPARGQLVGLAVSGGAKQAFYVPFAGKGQTVPPSTLATWLIDPDRPKVGHDVKAAVVAFACLGIEVQGVVGDTAIASHLADPAGMAPHDLARVGQVRLRRPVHDIDALRGRGKYQKKWAQLPVGKVGELAGHLAETTGALWRHFAPDLQQDLHDEALALSWTLCRMERAGMLVDPDDLARAGEDFDATRAELEQQVYALAGKEFNINSTKQLGAVLYEDLGLPVLSRTKTGWSTATSVLERLEHAHPIVPLVIHSRLLKRLRDTWVKSLLGSLDDDNRVRSTFHPARSFSGRLVNTNPDLGRVPGRTEELARIRHAFVAPAGWVLLSVDYDQLGLYVLAHLTEDPALVEPLSRGDDIHTATASAVLEVAPDDVTDEQRQIGKVVNFATFAGQGSSALAQQLGVSAAEAKDLIARFDVRYAVVRAFQDEQLRFAREHGYVETISGRRWRIGDLNSLDLQMRAYGERMARRGTHEGSVADVSRRGLLRADQALRAAGSGAFPLVQVHDEVVFEVPASELEDAAALAASAMREAWDLVVPLRVGSKAGPNWADMESLDA